MRKQCQFVADFRCLSEFCNYVCTHCYESITDILMRARLMCGVRDSRKQHPLLAKDNTFTFEIALDKATAMEVAGSGGRGERERERVRERERASVCVSGCLV